MRILSQLNRGLGFGQPIARSAFVQGLACLVVLYLALTLIPRQLFQGARQWEPSTTELLSKIPAFLSLPSDPDVVMMGSSLLIAPALSCDEDVPGVQLPPPGPARGYQYDKASFLERLLEEKAGRTIKVFNLAIPATMMSDQCLLVEEVVARGKRPGIIVFGLAPRDFVANDQPVPAATPIAREINRLRAIRDNGFWGKVIGISEAISANLEDCKQKVSGGKSKLQNGLIQLRDGLSPAGSSEPSSAEGERLTAKPGGRLADGGIEARTEEQMAFYRRIYTPYHPDIFEKQCQYLERALGKAAANGISVLVVNMPLSRENTSLLDAQAMRRYQETLAEVTKKYSVPYLDLGTNVEQHYRNRDFTDSVHLGNVGGKRFFTTLSQALTQEPRLLQKLVSMR